MKKKPEIKCTKKKCNLIGVHFHLPERLSTPPAQEEKCGCLMSKKVGHASNCPTLNLIVQKQKNCNGMHCKCMNLDKQCPNNHYGDHICPQEDRYSICYQKGYEEGLIKGKELSNKILIKQAQLSTEVKIEPPQQKEPETWEEKQCYSACEINTKASLIKHKKNCGLYGSSLDLLNAQSEEQLKWFLNSLNALVFVKSTISATGRVENLNAEVLDMEAIIKISGEWDREDLKDILAQVSEQARTEAETRGWNEAIEALEKEIWKNWPVMGDNYQFEDARIKCSESVKKTLESLKKS